MATNHKITISGSDDLSKLESFAEQVSNYYHLDDTYFSNVIMCLDALKSLCDVGYASKNWAIDINVYSERKGLVFSVKDQGDIISPAIIPESITPELLDREGGEILFTLGSLTDFLYGNKEDGTVELVFSTHSMHRDLSTRRSAVLVEYFRQGITVRSN